MANALRPNRAFPDPSANPSPAGASSPGDLPEHALLRALLAGVVALIVMLLPAQLAASAGDSVASGGKALEIIRRDTC